MKKHILICIIYIVAVQLPYAQPQTTQSKSAATTIRTSTNTTKPTTTTISKNIFS